MNLIYINLKKISSFLNVVNTTILMLILFIFIFTPIGILRKNTKKSNFLGFDKNVQTYYKQSDVKQSIVKTIKDYERPF